MRFWYLLNCRATNAQASLCNCTDSPGHSLLAYTNYGVFNFRKSKCLSIKRRIWKYDDGNYEMLRQKALATSWNDFQNNNINTYRENLIYQSITEMCIPNKVIAVRLSV